MNKYNPNIHHRRTIRLKGYDYSQTGLYFITICTKNRGCLFGEIRNGKMVLNDAGDIANKCWYQITNHFPNTILHEHIIMPNHVHGIIEITVGANNHSPENHSPENHSPENHSPENHSPENHWPENHWPENHWPENHSPENHWPENISQNDRAKNISPLPVSPSKTIGSIVRGYKIGVTKWFRVHMPAEFPIGHSIWQRNFWEHIIRNQQSYDRISDYIINNPKNWKKDKLFDK
jgi:putative transposase